MRLRFVLLVLTVAGCGSGSETSDASNGADGGVPPDSGNVEFRSTCVQPMVCGGDLVGQWTFVRGCTQVHEDPFPQCGANRNDSSRGNITGTLDFADGHYSLMRDFRLRLFVSAPLSCAGACAQAFDEPCLRSGNDCLCGATDSDGLRSGGSYTPSDTAIMLGITSYSYCVDGDTLWLANRDAVYPELSVIQLVRSN